jgi:hypothetical protein
LVVVLVSLLSPCWHRACCCPNLSAAAGVEVGLSAGRLLLPQRLMLLLLLLLLQATR